jgi:hypothetical protein
MMFIKHMSVAFICASNVFFSYSSGQARISQQKQIAGIEGEWRLKKESASQKAQKSVPDIQERKLPEKPQAPPRSLELALFANDVRSAPPEFAADLLVRLAQSSKMADPDWKRELLEEAFRLAATVQQPVKRVALPSSLTDTRAGFLASAFQLDLDGLSLQCRAVNALLSIDKQKAREMFGQIAISQLPRLDCEEPLPYDVSVLYSTLRKVAESAFSLEEIKNNEHVRLLESRLSQIAYPSEVVPALELINTIKLSPTQRQTLVDSFSVALGKVSGDDLCFTHSLYDLDRAIKRFMDQYANSRVSTYALLRAYRSYLIRQFTAPRCAASRASALIEHEAINNFNRLRARSDGGVLEISADDVKSERIEGSIKTHAHWSSPKSAALLMKIKRLRFGSGKTPLNASERDTLDWHAEMESFLNDLAAWKKEDEDTPEDYFHQKCVLLKALIEMTIRKETRENLIISFIDTLNDFDLNRGSRIEWFWHAKFLFVDTKRFDGPSGSAPNYVVNKSDVLPLLDSTKSPVLYLYAQAEKLLDKHP